MQVCFDRAGLANGGRCPVSPKAAPNSRAGWSQMCDERTSMGSQAPLLSDTASALSVPAEVIGLR